MYGKTSCMFGLKFQLILVGGWNISSRWVGYVLSKFKTLTHGNFSPISSIFSSMSQSFSNVSFLRFNRPQDRKTNVLVSYRNKRSFFAVVLWVVCFAGEIILFSFPNAFGSGPYSDPHQELFFWDLFHGVVSTYHCPRADNKPSDMFPGPDPCTFGWPRW